MARLTTFSIQTTANNSHFLSINELNKMLHYKPLLLAIRLRREKTWKTLLVCCSYVSECYKVLTLETRSLLQYMK